MLGVVRSGIMGGTFDPIHIAHLHAAEVALQQLELDRVLFIPAGDPWQKRGRQVTAARHRLEMVRLATQGVDGFEVDTREIDRNGPTYTIDTLESFPADEELFLIVGADAAMNMTTWNQADEVLARVTVLVAPRPGIDIVEVALAFPSGVVLDMAPLDVSATNVRKRLKAGKPHRFLVGAEVADYIAQHNLYADQIEGDRVGSPIEQEQTS